MSSWFSDQGYYGDVRLNWNGLEEHPQAENIYRVALKSDNIIRGVLECGKWKAAYRQCNSQLGPDNRKCVSLKMQLQFCLGHHIAPKEASAFKSCVQLNPNEWVDQCSDLYSDLTTQISNTVRQAPVFTEKELELNEKCKGLSTKPDQLQCFLPELFPKEYYSLVECLDKSGVLEKHPVQNEGSFIRTQTKLPDECYRAHGLLFHKWALFNARTLRIGVSDSWGAEESV